MSASAAIAASGSAPSSSATSSRSPPIVSLSSSDVPAAITLPWSITTILSASRSASSRYCVVSRTVEPSATRASIVSHMPKRARGSRPGGRLVEEDHRRAEDERGGEVQPPAHAARVRLGGTLGRVGELEALEQLVRALARLGALEVVELPDHLEVLEAGQVVVDRGVLSGEPDLGPQDIGVAHDVEARDPGAAAVGLEQRGQDPYRGGLAGAVGTEEAEDRSRSRRRSPRHTARASSVGLLQPLDDDRMIVHESEASE